MRGYCLLSGLLVCVDNISHPVLASNLETHMTNVRDVACMLSFLRGNSVTTMLEQMRYFVYIYSNGSLLELLIVNQF